MQITKDQAIRFLLAYHHLTDATAIPALSDIPDYVGRVGCIQFDPLDTVGRNPDLVLQSRCPQYRRGDIDRLLYEERRLFDVWDKNMSICRVEDWPYLTRPRAHIRPEYDRLRDGIAVVTQYLREHECASSSDIDLPEKVRWYWGSHRLSKAALECMCYAGRAIVHHKNGTRRYYCLPETALPAELLEQPDPNPTEADHCRWQVLRRINSIGLLWNRGGDAWLGLMDWKSEHRETGFRLLLDEGAIEEVSVFGVRYPLYIAKEHLALLGSVMHNAVPEDNVRILAPLDNLIWERKLIQQLFGFDYRWEVYTPAEKRRYGYYVLPVLAGERFVARIEPVADRREGVLAVKGFWWEASVPDRRRLAKHIRACVKRLARYAGCAKVRYDAPS